jgi:hypothetical protein
MTMNESYKDRTSFPSIQSCTTRLYKLDYMQCTYKVLQITAAAYAYHMKETNFGYGIRTSENIFDINCHIMVHLIIGNHLKLMSLRGNNEN